MDSRARKKPACEEKHKKPELMRRSKDVASIVAEHKDVPDAEHTREDAPDERAPARSEPATHFMFMFPLALRVLIIHSYNHT